MIDLDNLYKSINASIMEEDNNKNNILVIYVDREVELNNIRENIKESSNKSDGLNYCLDNIGFLHYPETSKNNYNFLFYKPYYLKKPYNFNIILYKETHAIPVRGRMIFKKIIKESIYIPLIDEKSIDLSMDEKNIKIEINTDTSVEFIRDNKKIALVSKGNKEEFFSIQPQDKSKYFHYKECIDKKNKLTIDIILSDNKEFKNGIEVEGVSKIKRVGWAIDSEFYSDPCGDYMEGYDGEKYCKHAGNNEEFLISDLSYQKISGNYRDDPYLKFFSDSIVIKNNLEKNNLVFYTPLGLPIGYFKDDKIHRFDRNVTRIFSKEKNTPLLLLVGAVIIQLY